MSDKKKGFAIQTINQTIILWCPLGKKSEAKQAGFGLSLCAFHNIPTLLHPENPKPKTTLRLEILHLKNKKHC